MSRSILSLGARIQSTDLLLRGLRGEFGTRSELAVFSDTGCEPKAVYQYLEWLMDFVAKEFHFTIEVVKPGNIYEHALSYINEDRNTSDGIPYHVKTLSTGNKGILKRQCTADYKIAPVRRFIRQYLGKLEPVDLWLGISYDELIRMKEANVKWITHRFPLIEKKLTRLDCINNFKKYKLPLPTRSSCIVCPYHSNKYWLWLYQNEPESFEAAVVLDKKIRNYPGITDAECYLHHSCKSLSEVIVAIVKESKLSRNQLQLFPELIDECDGVCGV